MGFLQTFTGGGSLSYKTPVRAASTGNVALSGSLLTITPFGGVTLADKDRVLLKDQSDPSENGIYTVAIIGSSYTLFRASDANNNREIVPGMLVPVTEGDFEEEVFQLATNAPITLGTTGLTFQEIDSVVETQITALELLQEAQVVHVRKNGNDLTGNGGPHRPFLTIQAALQSITDASPTKRYVVKVASGIYNETGTLSLKANVFVVGDGMTAVRISATSFAMAPDFTGSADNRSGFSQCALLSPCDFNWQTVTSGAGKLYFNEVSFVSTVSLYGHNNPIAQAMFDSCQLYGNLTITGVNVGIFTNNICFANVTLNQHPNTNMASLINATGGHCNGTVRFNTTVNNFNRRSAGFLRSFWCENLIADGPSSYVDFDLDSGSKQGAQSLNGGNLVPLTPEIHHDIVTRMVKPKNTNSHYSGDFGQQWFFNFAYVHASTGTDLYLMSTASSFGADSSGKSVFILPDAYGLQTDVSGGNIVLETAPVTGTGVRGKIELDAREIDVVSTKIVNLADGTAPADAVNKSQLDSAVGDAANRTLSNLTSPTAVNQVLLGQDGTASAPAYSFISNPNTGIYRSSQNVLGIASNGNVRGLFSNTESRFYGHGGYANRYWSLTNGGNGLEIITDSGFSLARYNTNLAMAIGPGSRFGAFGATGAIGFRFGLGTGIPVITSAIFGNDEAQGTGKRLAIATPDNPWGSFGNVSDTVDLGTFSIVGNIPSGDRPKIRYTAFHHQFRVASGSGNTNNGTEALLIKNDGITKLRAELSLKSLHAQTGTISASTEDCYVGCNTAAAVTVNLPAASTVSVGKMIIIKDEAGTADTNPITIQPSGSDLIDLQGAYSLNVGLESVTLVCNGVDKWFII